MIRANVMRFAVTCECGCITELDESDLSSLSARSCAACGATLTESALAAASVIESPLQPLGSQSVGGRGTFQQLWQARQNESADQETGELKRPPEGGTTNGSAEDTQPPSTQHSLWDVMKSGPHLDVPIADDDRNRLSENQAQQICEVSEATEILAEVDIPKSKSLWSLMAARETSAVDVRPNDVRSSTLEASVAPARTAESQAERLHDAVAATTSSRTPARTGSLFASSKLPDDDAELSRRAVVALATAIGAVLLSALSLQASWVMRLPPLIAGLIAVLLGVMAAGDIRRSRGELKGRSLATVAMVLGAIGMFLAPIVFARLGDRHRDRSTRLEIESRLQNIGKALDQFHTQAGHYPSASTFAKSLAADKQPLHGWMTPLLPHLGHQQIFERIDQRQPFDAPANIVSMQQLISEFSIPGRQPQRSLRGFALTHFSGVGGQALREPQGLVHFGLFDEAGTVRREQITDGLANTLIVGEIADGFLPWGQPGNVRFLGDGLNRQFHGFGNPAGTGATFLHADGSAKFYSKNVDRRVLEQLETRDGAEVLAP